MSVTPALRSRYQKIPRARWPSRQNSELWVQWGTLTRGNKVKRVMEEGTNVLPGLCMWAHRQAHPHTCVSPYPLDQRWSRCDQSPNQSEHHISLASGCCEHTPKSEWRMQVMDVLRFFPLDQNPPTDEPEVPRLPPRGPQTGEKHCAGSSRGGSFPRTHLLWEVATVPFRGLSRKACFTRKVKNTQRRF